MLHIVGIKHIFAMDEGMNEFDIQKPALVGITGLHHLGKMSEAVVNITIAICQHF